MQAVMRSQLMLEDINDCVSIPELHVLVRLRHEFPDAWDQECVKATLDRYKRLNGKYVAPKTTACVQGCGKSFPSKLYYRRTGYYSWRRFCSKACEAAYRRANPLGWHTVEKT